jgi:hypothetical protein
LYGVSTSTRIMIEKYHVHVSYPKRYKKEMRQERFVANVKPRRDRERVKRSRTLKKVKVIGKSSDASS